MVVIASEAQLYNRRVRPSAPNLERGQALDTNTITAHARESWRANADDRLARSIDETAAQQGI